MKKASLFSWALVFIGFIILTSTMFIMVAKKNKFFDEDGFFTIGSKQFKLIELYHQGEAALLYVDQAAKLSIAQSLFDVGRSGGFFNQTTCGDYINYPVWADASNPEKNCYPDVEDSFRKYLQENLNIRLADYPEMYFPENNYVFSISLQSVIGIALEPIQFMIEYAKPIGNPYDKDNQIHQCNSGDCVAQRAIYYGKLYEPLPYVFGGESPYSYETSVKDQAEKGKDSVFYGVGLTKYQPAGIGIFSVYRGKLTIPGFDCTGLVWWILKHTGFGQYYRDSAYGLYQQVKNRGATLICSLDTNPCTKNYIKKHAKPGDLMFIHPCAESTICHAAIYVGNNKLVESTGSNGPIYRDIPDVYYPGNEYQIHSIYRPDYSISYETAPVNNIDNNENVFDAPIEPTISSQYTVRPSFKVPLDFDFDIYEKVIDQVNSSNGIIARSLLCELQGDQLEACIQKEFLTLNTLALKDPNALLWELDCEKGKEQVFYTFVRGYSDCLNSPDSDCVCSFSMDYKTGSGEEEYNFILTQQELSMNMGLKDNSLNYSIPYNLLIEGYELDNEIFFRNVNTIRYEVTYDNAEFRRAYLFVEDNRYDADAQVYLYKNILGNLGFLPQDELEKLRDYKLCKLPEQRTFRICVHTNKIFRVYDELNKKVDNKGVVIRFAVAFPELTS